MIRDFVFQLDSSDLGEVQPNLSLDIATAFETGKVTGVGAPPAEYNGIDDPNDIRGVVKDSFDLYKAGKDMGLKANITTPNE